MRTPEQIPSGPAGFGAPRIIDPMPSGRPLPLMQTIQDAAKLNVQERTTFYVSAFLFGCWVSELTLANSAEIAEKPDPKDRSFQTGQAWRGFLKYFGHASDAEFPAIFGHLMQFADYDDPLAEHVREAVLPLSIEHQLTGEFLGRHTPRELIHQPKKVLALMRATTTRLCDWLDAALHFRILHEWHIMPDCFDPDPQKREMAYLGINQRHFDRMDEQAQARHLIHMSDAVEELPDSPKWAAYRQAASAPVPESRPWPTQLLDRAIINIWPLFKHRRWSAADLFYVLGKVLAPADLVASCPDVRSLAAYCADTLCLRDGGLDSDHRHGIEPPACSVATRICAGFIPF